eukprot:6475861-Amphidinium_carterae.1
MGEMAIYKVGMHHSKWEKRNDRLHGEVTKLTSIRVCCNVQGPGNPRNGGSGAPKCFRPPNLSTFWIALHFCM